ncbi:MAG: tRNA (guanosine(37)-N1)-methyltransferase TrmD [Pseudomonadota bacterium]|nr:tRNA (guanosine(37)-N1)-methyltransferase TrmD [Pseudomonadota bacterium]
MKSAPWTAHVLTLFPEMFPGPLCSSLAGKALAGDLWRCETDNIRKYAIDSYGTVDDTPFGGGPGMVMRPDVLETALFAKSRPKPVVYLTPRGKPLDQQRVRDLAAGEGVTLVCGRYEGVDQRVLDAHDIEEISVGDFVLSGGEPAAMILIDACVRLLPGVMGNAETAGEESFTDGLLEYPHYTRPALWRDRNGQERAIPEVLTSGHHANIRDWRQRQAEAATKERRPDLWQKKTEIEIETHNRLQSSNQRG